MRGISPRTYLPLPWLGSGRQGGSPERYQVITLATHEFIRRFLIHVLPAGFHRIRYYGLLASGKRAENIARARELLMPPIIPVDAIKAIIPNATEPESAATIRMRGERQSG